MLKVGLIGTGNIAKEHMSVLSSLENIKVVGCCDVSGNRAETFAAKWDIPYHSNSVVTFLKETECDCIHILVPPDHHHSVAKTVLENKVSVFMEKPMCLSVGDCDELIDIADRYSLTIGLNHNMVFHPLFLRLKEDLKNGIIGEIDQMTFFQGGPLGQLDARKYNHWMLRKPQNILFELGPHPVSQVLDLMGSLEKIYPTVSGKIELGHEQTFYDHWNAAAYCKNGGATINLCFGQKYYLQIWLRVSGQDGSIYVDLYNNLYLMQRKSSFPDYLDSSANALRYLKTAGQGINNFLMYAFSKLKLKSRNDVFYIGLQNSIRSFYRSLISGEEVPVSGRNGRDVIRFCEQWSRVIEPEEREAKPAIDAKTRVSVEPEIFVTGASGFIGNRIIMDLVKQGKAVRALVRNANGLPKHFSSPLVDIVEGDLSNREETERCVRGIKYVYHLAHSLGANWEEFKQANLEKTEMLANISEKFGIRYFFFTSTIAVYCYADHRNSLINESLPIDNRIKKRNNYAKSKILIENYLVDKYSLSGFPVVIFRPAVVIGEGGSLYHSGVGEWDRDNVCSYWGTGKNPLPFILVEDVSSAMINAMDVPGLEGESFNLAGDVTFPAREYIGYVKKFSGRNIRAYPYPMGLRILSEIFKYSIKFMTREHKNALLSYRDLSNRAINATFDNSKAKNKLNWQPEQDKEAFVKKAIAWAFNPE